MARWIEFKIGLSDMEAGALIGLLEWAVDPEHYPDTPGGYELNLMVGSNVLRQLQEQMAADIPEGQ